jgi:hypothetical protein
VKRTVSTPHLVLGIVFAGIATLWFVGAGTDANLHDTAPGFPLVLIGAGLVGLVASLANSRSRKQRLAAEQATVDESPYDDSPYDDSPADDTWAETGAEPETATDLAPTDAEATTVIHEENR